MSVLNEMTTCGTCLHLARWHRMGRCRVESGCSCIEFVESVLSRPVESDWLKVGGFRPVRPGRETRDAE